MKKIYSVAFLMFAMQLVNAQNSVQIGRSSNAYSMLRTSQNQVFVNPDLNIVGFIYRHDITQYGQTAADNGRLRFSISTDGGTTWNSELGVLNNTYTRRARYPQAFLYNPSGNSDPDSAFIVWSGATLPSNFDGLVNGTCEVTTTNPVTTSETYQFQGSSSLIPGGLCESTSGIFWMVDFATTADTTVIDSINVYKGTFSGSSVNWVRHTSLHAPHSRSFDGNVHASGPNIAFSPDGQTGYVVFLGDINSADSTYNPVIYKSTDAGNTWSTANELIVNNIPAVGDSIQQWLFDTGTSIESASEVAPAFECDITVDANGNLHIFTTLCAVERRDTTNVVTGEKGYVVYSGYPKNAIDLYTTDGGTTWTSFYVAQVNTFRTDVPEGATTLSVDCYNQISRTADGNIMFYSWSDTDTLIYQGTTDNTNPNTYIAAFDLSTGHRTCWKQVIGVANEERAITPTMAPYVLVDNITTPNKYTLPIVTQDVLVDALNPVTLHYIGAGAYFCKSDFWDPAWHGAPIDLSWSFTSQCYNYTNNCYVSIETQPELQFNLYPNPASEAVNIQITEGDKVDQIFITNSIGQIVRTIKPNVDMDNLTYYIPVNDLAPGMYTLSLSTQKSTYSKKFTVVK